MERTKKFILKKIQKIFLFVKICEKKCRQKELKAFSLIEMLIVLAIISILILLFVPNLIKEKSANCKMKLATLSQAKNI
ncbi:prepilin-type N-terminal cleavage/methylation domain-containing protein, partial [Streptomyces sp. NPDC001832]|uniref:prepilin-type N-terminal cleavage/methylation domain-containing protein n=1 Tax=Streptomyces sp. NPDC001832 TaxID=3154527 RepID=UPI003321AB26